jgi:uncharacterized protein (TIRG00374 family)
MARLFHKKNFFNFFGVLLALAILTGFTVASGGPAALAASLLKLDARWLLCTLLFIGLYWFLEALVLQVLTLSVRKGYKFGSSFQTSLVGMYYNAITPFATGGQPAQLYVMSQSGLDAGAAGSILITKSIIYQTCLTILSIVSVVLSAGYFQPRVPYFGYFVLAGLLLNFLAVVVLHALTKNSRVTRTTSKWAVRLLQKLKLIRSPRQAFQKLRRHIAVFHRSSAVFNKSTAVQVLSYAVTIIQFLAYYAVPFCIYKSFGFSGASVFLMIYAQSIITMITAFIPLPGASGAAEGSFYLFFSLFFHSAAILPAILLWRFLTYYLNILTGGVLWGIRFAAGGRAAGESAP